MNQQSEFYLPGVSPQDISQEQALFSLTHPGSRSRRIFIQRRLQPRELSFGHLTEMGEGQITGLAFSAPEPDLQAPEELVKWATSQGEEALEIILQFLSSPEEMLKETLQLLKEQGYITEVTPPKPQVSTRSASQVIREEALAGKTFDQLVQMVREQFPSKRPEAFVRTVLRRAGIGRSHS